MREEKFKSLFCGCLRVALALSLLLHFFTLASESKQINPPSNHLHCDTLQALRGFLGAMTKEERKSDFENSEDDKRTIIASLKKKAINASSKFRHSLKKKRSQKKNGGQINSVSIEDVWDAGELQALDAFRQALISKDLLPPRHDDCHMLLREGFDGVWEWDLPIASQPCIEQQANCLNLVQKG